MAHTYTCLHYHYVFSTLGRRNLIAQDLLDRLHGYIGGIVRNIGGFPVSIGGTGNHIHALIGWPARVSVPSGARDIKANSSGWVHETFPVMSDFAWQEGYAAFAVSRSNLDSVAQYIADQARHHRTMSFEEEFLALLDKHGIEYDPRDVFD